MLKDYLQSLASEIEYDSAIKELKHLCIESAKEQAIGMRVKIEDLAEEYVPEDLESALLVWAQEEGLKLSVDNGWVKVMWNR